MVKTVLPAVRRVASRTFRTAAVTPDSQTDPARALPQVAAPTSIAHLTPAHVQVLQRTVGNRAVSHLLSQRAIAAQRQDRLGSTHVQRRLAPNEKARTLLPMIGEVWKDDRAQQLLMDENVAYTIAYMQRPEDESANVDGKTAGQPPLYTIIYESNNLSNDAATLAHEILLHAVPLYIKMKEAEVQNGPQPSSTNEEDHQNLKNWLHLVIRGAEIALNRQRLKKEAIQTEGLTIYKKILADMAEHLNPVAYDEVIQSAPVQQVMNATEFGRDWLAFYAKTYRPEDRVPPQHVPADESDDARFAAFYGEIAQLQAVMEAEEQLQPVEENEEGQRKRSRDEHQPLSLATESALKEQKDE